MNSNCCHDTSNLTNPSQQIIHHVGPYPQSQDHHKECFYYDELPSSAQISRQQATTRCQIQGRFITDLYTFENDELTAPTNDTSMAQRSTTTTANPSHPQHIEIHLPTNTNPPAPPNEETMTAAMDDVEDKSLELLSLHLSQQGSIHPSQTSANPTPPKRKCPTPDYIHFYTDLTTDVPSLISAIIHQLDEANLPGHCFNHNFFTGSPSHPSQMNQQLISIEITQAEHTTSLLSIIGKLYPTSYPQRSTAPLPQINHSSSISLTPIPPNTWAKYCQLSTCPLHNNGLPFMDNTPHGCEILQLHVRNLHSSAFLSLPPEQLTLIGWTQCCPECPQPILIPTDLSSHQESCIIYTTKPASIPPHQAPTQPTNHSENPRWALAFQICPPARITNLNNILTRSSASPLPPAELNQNILEIVTRWFLATVNTQPTTNTATPNINND
jgi:hypothetical protein